jgi:hypothetical protein
MEKNSGLLGLIFFAISLAFIGFSLGASNGGNCNLNVSLVNQDPYPAIPGDSLKLVFQVGGIDSTNCGDIELYLSEDFPFTLDPASEKSYTLKSGTYNTKDYKTYFQAPFKVRVDEQALDGETLIEVRYRSSTQPSGAYLTKQFQIEVKDVRADFEVFVKDYDASSNSITFQVLNIGKEDISAVTMEIPLQEGVLVKGANKNIMGDLDSNEDTTVDFQLVPSSDEINSFIYYTDSTGERRSIEKKVSFEKDFFTSSDSSSKTSVWTYIFYGLILLAIFYFIYKKFLKKKKSNKFSN